MCSVPRSKQPMRDVSHKALRVVQAMPAIEFGRTRSMRNSASRLLVSYVFRHDLPQPDFAVAMKMKRDKVMYGDGMR